MTTAVIRIAEVLTKDVLLDHETITAARPRASPREGGGQEKSTSSDDVLGVRRATHRSTARRLLPALSGAALPATPPGG